jgi:hypothetical protein
MYNRKRLTGWLLLLTAGWIIIDLSYPFKTDISRIDAQEIAIMDAAMWRSYYEKRPVKLFFQSAALMRREFHFPLWRSYRAAWYAAKAAFVFKDGKNQGDYEKALPPLQHYYGLINNISFTRFNKDSAATSELQWWIIRRNRHQHPPLEWENNLALTAAVIYHLPAGMFSNYAHLRVEAMLLRDAKGNAITEADWQKIHALLLRAWQSFSEVLNGKHLQEQASSCCRTNYGR